jgi:NAD(P)-dependent dehydrogenase (short-subunit alcohol dehydrogenase family)
VIHGVHAFLPLLERNADWGHVVNTSSISVMLAPPNTAAHVASKAAVLSLTEVLAAIRADQLYLITHEEFAPQITDRHERIAAGVRQRAGG